MGYDKRNVLRGKCKKCKCKEFTERNVKCECGHVPTAHEAIDNGVGGSVEFRDRVESSQQLSYAGAVMKKTDLETPRVTTISQQHPASHLDQLPVPAPSPKQALCRFCSGLYLSEFGVCPFCVEQCKNPSCTNLKFIDNNYGKFDYCSPSCRDKDLLTKYNKKLEEDLTEGYSTYTRKKNQDILPHRESHYKALPPTVTTGGGLTISQHDKDGQNTTANTKPSTCSTISVDTFYGSATATSNGSQQAQRRYSKQLPKNLNTVLHFSKTLWAKEEKTGLSITGIAVGTAAELQWLDVIIGTTTPRRSFNNNMDYAKMVDALMAEDMVEVWREYDFKLIVTQINRKVKTKDKMIAFFIPHHAEIQEYGLQLLDYDNLVMLRVSSGKMADQCGIKDSDIVEWFGIVDKKEIAKFTLTAARKKEPIKVACEHLKSSPDCIGLVLVVKRINIVNLV
ncbi:uncharacterized protein [Dysidea avara]|uniref:uncharacterized protein isoform X2 n=1 Tax=Dysidea avara TaxID=196820 RepID=UPI003316F73A